MSVKLEILKPVASKDDKKKKRVKKADDGVEGAEAPEEEDENAKRIRYKANLKECEEFMIDCLE